MYPLFAISAADTIDASAKGALLSICPFEDMMLCAFSVYVAYLSSAKCARRCKFDNVTDTALGSVPSCQECQLEG